LENTGLKNTPLLNEHIKLGATMVPFGGWNMPVQYTNVINEHNATRTKAGIFDICHMGEFIVMGPDSQAFLQKIVTNDISKLEISQACYNCMCKEDGTVIDDLFVYKLADDEFFVVVNASTIEKDFSWLTRHKHGRVEIKNLSEDIGKIDLQGPNSQEILQKLTDYDLGTLKRFRAARITFNGISEQILISRTGYTGEDGFEIYFSPKDAAYIWNSLLTEGKDLGITPCGLGARDTLRLEACYSLYGHEINEKLTPMEAGLGFAVKLAKDFIGKEVLQKQKENGTEKKLICFEMVEKSIPRENYPLLVNGEEVGFVTSGTFSPTFRKGLGMAYIRSDLSQLGNEVSILIRGKEYKGAIVERPFYKFKGGKS
jgi:aminomethyltransferase